MSDSEDASSEEEEIISLDEVQNKFAEEVGHKPHSVQQMLAYCKQNNIPHKFRDINKWWPSRPEPELKPVQKAVQTITDTQNQNLTRSKQGYVEWKIIGDLLQQVKNATQGQEFISPEFETIDGTKWRIVLRPLQNGMSNT
eukprot:583754_1